MRVVPVLAMMSLLLLGCSDERRLDVSEQAEFKHLVGMEYEAMGPVDAYGIRAHSQAAVDYVTLIPPPGIAGSYVGFRVPLQSGSTVVVLRVLKTNRWPDRSMSFDVALKGTQLPTTAPVRIDLFRGNEGKADTDLNPNFYRPLGSRK
jgi:hypothetical protein